MFKNKSDYSVFWFVIITIVAFLIFAGLTFFIWTVHIFDAVDRASRKVNSLQDAGQSADISGGDPYLTIIKNFSNSIGAPLLNGLDPMFGNEKADVAIVQYSDFGCEFCLAQEKILQDVVGAYQGSVKLIRKDYPAGDISSYSWQSAISARCAGEQGKYWQYHDLLYRDIGNQNKDFMDFAKSLALDVAKFSSCLKDSGITALIKNNVIEADALRIKGVPSLFINDREFLGEMSESEIRQIVDGEMKK
jgi:predicted DsbA family dithiol-disulfide isomerase